MMREVVVGYDVRLAPEAAAPAWLESRRHEYLLNLDAKRPLSVDEAVWPRKDTTLVEGKGLTVETPKFSSVSDALAAASPDEVVIAITQWQGMAEPGIGEPADPATVDPAWE